MVGQLFRTAVARFRSRREWPAITQEREADGTSLPIDAAVERGRQGFLGVREWRTFERIGVMLAFGNLSNAVFEFATLCLQPFYEG